jgi:hypothetical protein
MFVQEESHVGAGALTRQAALGAAISGEQNSPIGRGVRGYA